MDAASTKAASSPNLGEIGTKDKPKQGEESETANLKNGGDKESKSPHANKKRLLQVAGAIIDISLEKDNAG